MVYGSNAHRVNIFPLQEKEKEKRKNVSKGRDFTDALVVQLPSQCVVLRFSYFFLEYRFPAASIHTCSPWPCKKNIQLKFKSRWRAQVASLHALHENAFAQKRADVSRSSPEKAEQRGKERNNYRDRSKVNMMPGSVGTLSVMIKIANTYVYVSILRSTITR